MNARDIAKTFARPVRDIAQAQQRLWRARLANRDAYIGNGVLVEGDPSRIHLAPGANVHGPTALFCGDGGGLTGSRIEIGENTYVGEFNNIRTAGAPIVIGANCLVSQHITIVGTNHGTALGRTIVEQEWTGDGVRIGDDVWIGAGVTILPGTVIGNGAVIAANSVVRGEVPPNVVMGGAPARQISERR